MKDFNTIWQANNSQMGLRSARDSTVISMNGMQGSVEIWTGATGSDSFVCFVGLPHSRDWHSKGGLFGKTMAFLTTPEACMIEFLFLWDSWVRKIGILPLLPILLPYLTVTFLNFHLLLCHFKYLPNLKGRSHLKSYFPASKLLWKLFHLETEEMRCCLCLLMYHYLPVYFETLRN